MRLKLGGALITAMALTVGLAVPAYAETFADPAGDVAQVDANMRPTPTSKGPDITQVVATINPAWFIVTITLATPATKGWDSATVLLDTNKNNVPDYSIDVFAKNGALLSGDLIRVSSGSTIGDVRAKAAGNTLTITTRADSFPKLSGTVGFAVRMGRVIGSKTVDSRLDDFPDRTGQSISSALGGLQWQTLKVAKAKVTKLKATTPKVKLVKATVKKGTAAKLKISVKQKVSGTVLAFDGVSQYAVALGSAKLAKGKTVTLTLPKNLAAKYHAIRVRFMPDSLKHASSWSKFVTLIVKK